MAHMQPPPRPPKNRVAGPNPDALNFGSAIEALKNGSRVSRATWLSGSWIKLVPGSEGVEMSDGSTADVQDAFGALLVRIDGSRSYSVGWAVSAEDALAEDWYIVD